MGNLIWNEYARLVSTTASVYTIWSCFWGLFYRKFFWDFVGATLRDPGGIQPANGAAIFITLIVKFPVIQILTALIAMFMVCLEFPAPFVKSYAVHRSIVVRIVVLTIQCTLAFLFYQGTNGAIWGTVAIICYIRAQIKGETMQIAKDNKGRGGQA